MKKMLIILFLAQLACAFSVGEPIVGTETPAKIGAKVTESVPTNQWYTVYGDVNIRSCPNLSCSVVGHLDKGDQVLGSCIEGEKFCQVGFGYVSAACLGQGGKCVGK